MVFQPDILVSGPDGISLVVEAKTTLPDLKSAEEQLQMYMIGMACPLGMLVTPERMWLHRNLFSSPPQVEPIGEFEMSSVWPQPPRDPVQFEIFVQDWLDNLAYPLAGRFPANIREAIAKHVFPAVRDGEVRAAHPRFS